MDATGKMSDMSRREGIGGLALGLLALIVAVAIGVALVAARGDTPRSAPPPPPATERRPAAPGTRPSQTTAPNPATRTETEAADDERGRGRGRGRGGDDRR